MNQERCLNHNPPEGSIVPDMANAKLIGLSQKKREIGIVKYYEQDKIPPIGRD